MVLCENDSWVGAAMRFGGAVRPETTLNPLVVAHNLLELWQRHQRIMWDNAGEDPSIHHACQMSLISTQEQGYDEQFFHTFNFICSSRGETNRNRDKSRV